MPITHVDHGSEGGTDPKAYLNYILYDQNMTQLTAGGFKRVSTAARETGRDVLHERLAFDAGQINITQPGILYLYISNENPSPLEVYFDDFKVTHVKTAVVQSDDYYAFGLTFNNFTRENSTPNQFKYNSKEEQD